MVILHAFAQQVGQVLGREPKGVAGSRGLLLVELQPGGKAARPLAVGTIVEVHLHQAQIDPQLDLVAAVVPRHDSHRHFVRHEVPTGENGGDVFRHEGLHSKQDAASG